MSSDIVKIADWLSLPAFLAMFDRPVSLGRDNASLRVCGKSGLVAFGGFFWRRKRTEMVSDAVDGNLRSVLIKVLEVVDTLTVLIGFCA